MNKNRLWLLLLILIALAIRLTLLGKQSLWYDEGVTWMLSQMQFSVFINWTAADIQPPLYYLLIWLTDIIFGDSEWALRFPSTFFGILTVPLIYTLAHRLFSHNHSAHKQSIAPLLTATLLTISPLMIYYSQEARMYTLLIFETTLTSYLLLKILHPTNPKSKIQNPKSKILYALTAAAALYTHYFAAFLLAAHILYALYILWRQHFPKILLTRLAISFGGTLLLFAPWLPTLLARLGDDPSYWPGALKLDEVLRKVLITFTTGETVFEQTGWLFALIYIGFLIPAFGMQLIRPDPPTNEPTKSKIQNPKSKIFLLLWLFLPIILILTLTYQSPKFNPRYLLLAWPAFALITAAALAKLLEITYQASRLTFYASRTLFILFTLCILTLTTASLTNWFTNPRFSKDDFRALAQFVHERKASNETVLLSSGHLFPVWAYYSGWDNWTPLPWMLRLDVNRVTNLSIASDIATAIDGYEGVWLVTWQDEVIDPNGVVPFWLDLIGERPLDAGDFWGVGLEHWRLNPNKIGLLHKNPITRPVGFADSPITEQLSVSEYNFANQVDLLGFTQLNDTDMALFWRPRQPLPDNLIMTLRLTDSDGFSWSRETFIGRPGAYFYPPSRWPVGEIVMTQHQLPWQIGTPPGLYIAEIGLGVNETQPNNPTTVNAATNFVHWDVLDEQDHPQRRTALLDFVNRSHLAQPESGPLRQTKNPIVDFFPIVGVRRSILPQKAAQPGDRILLALLWQAGEYNLDNISVVFDLIDAEGQTHYVGSSFTPSRNFNLPVWNPYDMVLGQYWLDIPPEAVSGPARLQLHILNVSGFAYDEVFPLDDLEILPTERNFTPPDSIDIPLDADFSGQATLLGADCPANCRATSGESITLTLYWRAETTFKQNYTIFTHLLGPDETVLINADHPPPKPTQGWVPNEIIVDTVTLTIPDNISPGTYSLEVGLYDATDPAFQRLSLASGETQVILPQSLVVK